MSKNDTKKKTEAICENDSNKKIYLNFLEYVVIQKAIL